MQNGGQLHGTGGTSASGMWSPPAACHPPRPQLPHNAPPAGGAALEVDKAGPKGVHSNTRGTGAGPAGGASAAAAAAGDSNQWQDAERQVVLGIEYMGDRATRVSSISSPGHAYCRQAGMPDMPCRPQPSCRALPAPGGAGAACVHAWLIVHPAAAAGAAVPVPLCPGAGACHSDMGDGGKILRAQQCEPGLQGFGVVAFFVSDSACDVVGGGAWWGRAWPHMDASR